MPDDSLSAAASGMSRREFLIASGAASLLVLLDGCTFGQASGPASSATIPPGSTLYEQALKLLQQAVRSSPDHLQQRAADLVAAKDATKIVEFVRDRIGVAPIIENAGDPALSRRWGTAATLRGGLGTLRERADLLADLLNRAGFKAEVQVADRPAGITVETLYKARPAPAFTPDQSRVDRAAKLLRQSGAPAPAQPQAFNPGPDQVAAILGALPSSVQNAHTRQDLLPQSVPVVVFEQAGKPSYAFAIGDLGITNTAPAHLTTRGEDDVSKVIVTVSAMCNTALGGSTPRNQIIDLVKASWPADQVFGRQVLLTFPPFQGPKAILDSGLANLPLRLPTLHLQNNSLPVDEQASVVAQGPLITVHGDVLGPPVSTTDATAGTAGPYGPVKPLAGADRASALARVKAIQATASGASFPDVYVEFKVSDASGASVDGLDASSFSLVEGGQKIGSFALYSNAQAQSRPRVLVIYEGIPGPPPFTTDAQKNAFQSSLASALATQATKTPFDVQVVRPGNEPDKNAWAAPEASTLLTSFAGVYDSDDPWRSLGGAALDQGISAIVHLGDADVSDPNATQTAYYQRRLVASGVPVFFMPVGDVKTTYAQQIVSLSGGQLLSTGDPATPGRVAGLVGAVVAKWVGGGYRLRYTAPPEGPAQRTVSIGLKGQAQPVGTATYQLPAQPVSPPSFSGLYVTVQFGAVTAQRRIAGIVLGSDPVDALSQNPAVQTETRAALDGITTIAFEPGTPTPAALYDDVISSYLSLAPAVPIWGSATNDQLLQALGGGVLRTPVLLPLLFAPSTVDPNCVPGMRVAILQERQVGLADAEIHVDLAVGLNEVIPLSVDGRNAFKAAVATSVAECRNEAATLPDTAFARLAGVPLTAITHNDYGGLNSWLKTVPPERLLRWTELVRLYGDYQLVVPTGGAVDAMWVVNPQTGVAKAVLLDSTGGGMIRLDCKNPTPEEAFSFALAVASLICAVAKSVGFWCVGINTAAAAMCAVQLFDNSADIGTPLGVLMGIPAVGKAVSLDVQSKIGVVLIVLTLASMKCFTKGFPEP